MVRFFFREGVLFIGRSVGISGFVVIALVGWLLGVTRVKALFRRECMVWRVFLMDGWGGIYWEVGKGRFGYFFSLVEDGVCIFVGRSGSDCSGEIVE